MSKGLEALDKLVNHINLLNHINGVERQEVFEPLVNKNKSIIEKELKALEIIKKKCSPLLKQYLLDLLPKEEYELLKEVLL